MHVCFHRPINSRRSSFVEFNSKLRKQIGYIGKSAPFLPIRISFVWKQKTNYTRSTYEKEWYGIEKETKKPINWLGLEDIKIEAHLRLSLPFSLSLILRVRIRELSLPCISKKIMEKILCIISIREEIMKYQCQKLIAINYDF